MPGKLKGKAFAISEEDARSYRYARPLRSNPGVTHIAAINGRGAYSRMTARRAMSGLTGEERAERAQAALPKPRSRSMQYVGRNPTPAQLAARRRFAEMSRSGKFSKNARKTKTVQRTAVMESRSSSAPTRVRPQPVIGVGPARSAARSPSVTSVRRTAGGGYGAMRGRTQVMAGTARKPPPPPAVKSGKGTRTRVRAAGAKQGAGFQAALGKAVQMIEIGRYPIGSGITAKVRAEAYRITGKKAPRKRKSTPAAAGPKRGSTMARKRRAKSAAAPKRRRTRRAATKRTRRRVAKKAVAKAAAPKRRRRKARRSTAAAPKRRARRTAAQKAASRRNIRKAQAVQRRGGAAPKRSTTKRRRGRGYKKNSMRRNELGGSLMAAFRLGSLATGGLLAHKVATYLLNSAVDRFITPAVAEAAAESAETPEEAAKAAEGVGEVASILRSSLVGGAVAVGEIWLANKLISDQQTKQFVAAGVVTSYVHGLLVSVFEGLAPDIAPMLSGDGTAARLSAMMGLSGSIDPRYTPIDGVGEYFEGPTAGVGEYFESGTAGLGNYGPNPDLYEAAAGYGANVYEAAAGYGSNHIDPSSDLDHEFNLMEAAAGVGVMPYEAAAGYGEYLTEMSGYGAIESLPGVDTSIPGGALWAGTRGITGQQSDTAMVPAGILQTPGGAGILG